MLMIAKTVKTTLYQSIWTTPKIYINLFQQKITHSKAPLKNKVPELPVISAVVILTRQQDKAIDRGKH